jgi:DMSO/TMAO reductase YedYZ molybdopterin-dependent catalytic subunit
MSNLSRRKLITTGLAATAGVSGLAAAGRLAERYGLLPPDHGGFYGAGHALTYASQRLLTRHSLAREFPRGQISARPFPNGRLPQDEEFKRLKAGEIAHWRLAIDSLVSNPASFSSVEKLERQPCGESFPRKPNVTL